MPFYRFQCTNCDIVFTTICHPDNIKDTRCQKCGDISTMLPSLINEPTVNVCLDGHKRKKVMRGINRIMKDRSKKYQKKYELGEMVEKFGVDKIAKNTNFINQKTGKIKKD